jgi:predicted solute-binding protein
MTQSLSIKISVVAIFSLLILPLSGCGKSQYDTCMESYQRLAGLAAQALLNGDEALSRNYEQEMLNTQVTCNLLFK